MVEIKKNIMYILTIIGTSCGVIGGWTGVLIAGLKANDQFAIWSGIITVGGMLFGLGIWTANLIIEVKRYINEKKREKERKEQIEKFSEYADVVEKNKDWIETGIIHTK